MSVPDPWRYQRWAFETRVGNPIRKAVLSMLAMMADMETGRCEAKQETLAHGVEVTDRAVRNHLTALVEAGLLARRKQFRHGGGYRGEEFLLLAPWVVEWPDGERVERGSGRARGTGVPGRLERGFRARLERGFRAM